MGLRPTEFVRARLFKPVPARRAEAWRQPGRAGPTLTFSGLPARASIPAGQKKLDTLLFQTYI
jgi:hypothetical protein